MLEQSYRGVLKDRFVWQLLATVNFVLLGPELIRRLPTETPRQITVGLLQVLLVANGILGLLIWVFSREGVND